jgi:RNA polymerase sigma-70 factor (ECF subfamily)
MISAASRDTSSCADALNRLCSEYWRPIYAFIRRKGHSREDAEDLTQAFFTRVLEHGVVAEARQDRGKFRSFLLTSATNFLANEWDRSRAQKRGGGRTDLSFDFDQAEETYSREPSHELTPEALFERQWATALLDGVLARQREEYAARGQGSAFDCLKGFLTGDQERGAYRDVAFALNMSDAAIRTAVHRLRQRYAELVRSAIAETVASPNEVEAEIRFLLAALERP